MKNTRIKEAFQNFDYKIPDDPELLIYDFYFMTIIAKNADLSQEPDIEWIVKDSVEKIVSMLYDHMNHALKWSLTCEMRHIFDNSFSPSISSAQLVFQKYSKFTMSFYNNLQHAKTIQNLPDFLSSIKDPKEFISSLENRIIQDPLVYEDNQREREIANKAIKNVQKNLNLSNLELAGIYEDFFNSNSWGHSFGGKNWAKIAVAWQRLLNAKKIKDRIIWIDHAYDLQHNTDTVFNKIRKYSKNSSYRWIAKALDWKKDVSDPRQFYNKVSPQLKRLVAYISKVEYGLTISDFEKNNSTPSSSSTSDTVTGSVIVPSINNSSINDNSFVTPINQGTHAGYFQLKPTIVYNLGWSEYTVLLTPSLVDAIINENNGSDYIYTLSDSTTAKFLMNVIKNTLPLHGPIVFGSSTYAALMEGTIYFKYTTSEQTCDDIFFKLKVVHSAQLLDNNSQDNISTDDDFPSWVKTASQGKPFKSVKKNLPSGTGTINYSFSQDLLKSWGLKNNSALEWHDKNVYLSNALISLIESKYAKIKWVLELFVSNVYIHYDRNLDEIQIIGKSKEDSYVAGWWKKGSLINSTFTFGTWNQGLFQNSNFEGNPSQTTWIKGNFALSSKFLSGTFKQHPSTIYHGIKGGIPTPNGSKIIVENSLLSSDDLYLEEDIIQTQLRTRKGWV